MLTPENLANLCGLKPEPARPGEIVLACSLADRLLSCCQTGPEDAELVALMVNTLGQQFERRDALLDLGFCTFLHNCLHIYCGSVARFWQVTCTFLAFFASE